MLGNMLTSKSSVLSFIIEPPAPLPLMFRYQANPTSLSFFLSFLFLSPILLLSASLQYENRKAEYFSAIWDVINWKAAEKRFE
jgi:superoxide dismutase